MWGFNKADKKKNGPASVTRFVASTAEACRREGFIIPDHDGDGTPASPFQSKAAGGHLDEIKTQMCYCRLQVADLLKALFPAFSSCSRCQIPWSMVRCHITYYSRGVGMFPLCEDCWAELQTPENRMPYYRELFNSWDRVGHPWREGNWNVIEAAVLLENIPDTIKAQTMAQAN